MGYGPQRQPCTALPCFKPITACSCSFHTYRGSTKRNFPSRLWRDVNSSSSHSHSTSLVKLGRDTRPTPTRKNGLTAPPMGVSAVHFSFVASAPWRTRSALIGQKIKLQGAGQATVSSSVMFWFASFYYAGIHVSLLTTDLNEFKYCIKYKEILWGKFGGLMGQGGQLQKNLS